MKLLLIAVLAFAGQSGPDALSESAKQLAIEKRYEEAAALWQRALEADPNHFPSLFNLGYMRYTQSQFARAAPLLERAVRARPNDFGAHYLLGATLVRLDQRVAGLREWRAALALQPSNVKLLEVMAIEYSNGDYYREACDAARSAMKLEPDDQKAYMVAIKACHDAHDPATLDLAAQAAAKFPSSARANFEYGYELQRVGRLEESLPYLKKAMSEDTSYEEPYFYYGDYLMNQDRYADAIGYFEKALQIRPDYVAACVSLARAYMSLEKYKEAADALNRCIRTSPKHPQPHLLLSQIYFRMGDEDRARQEKNLSLRLRRENPSLMEAPQMKTFPAEQARSERPRTPR